MAAFPHIASPSPVRSPAAAWLPVPLVPYQFIALLGPAWKTVAPFQPKSIAYNVDGQHYLFKATSPRLEQIFGSGRIVWTLNIVLQPWQRIERIRNESFVHGYQRGIPLPGHRSDELLQSAIILVNGDLINEIYAWEHRNSGICFATLMDVRLREFKEAEALRAWARPVHLEWWSKCSLMYRKVRLDYA